MGRSWELRYLKKGGGLMYGVVYLIENICNAKVYVGITTRGVSKRFEEHCVAETYIGKAIRKYGRDNFRISIIDQADDHFELCEKEKAWIKTYKAFGDGYNLTHGGDGVITTEFIDAELTDEQEFFIKWVDKENEKDLDVHNSTQMVKFVLNNMGKCFLIANTKKDKQIVSKALMKLGRNYLEYILSAGVFVEEDIKKWL